MGVMEKIKVRSPCIIIAPREEIALSQKSTSPQQLHIRNIFSLSCFFLSLQEIEAEMARTQKNKATNYHLGTLKAKLAKLRNELLIESSGGGGGGRK